MSTKTSPPRYVDLTGFTREDYERLEREWREWRDSPEGTAAYQAAIKELDETWRIVMEETNGLGIPHDALDEAIEFARDQ